MGRVVGVGGIYVNSVLFEFGDYDCGWGGREGCVLGIFICVGYFGRFLVAMIMCLVESRV